MERRNRTGAALVLALIALWAGGCDRRSVHLDTTGEPVAGPHSVPGGVRFVFEHSEAQSVHLAGAFNNWSTSADPLVRDESGRWSLVKQLPPGTYAYKFAINGGAQWAADPLNPQREDDGFGGHNSVLVVTAAGVQLPPAPGTGVAGATGAAGPAAAAGGGPKLVEGGWLFTLDMAGAQSVHLAGTFNNWSTSADPLQRNQDGVWVIVKALPPGTHQYKFTINGGQSWKEDPTNPNAADDGYGGKNSTLVVP